MYQKDKDKKGTLWLSSVSLIDDQSEQERLWQNFAGEQFKAVVAQLILFHTTQLLDTDESVAQKYPMELKKKVLADVGELVHVGFYIYCADVVYVKHEFKDYHNTKPYNDAGLKEYLFSEMQLIEDEGEIKKKIEPPAYAHEVIKTWSLWWLANMALKSDTFNSLGSEAHKDAYMHKIAWLISTGYVVTSLQKYYRDSKHKTVVT